MKFEYARRSVRRVVSSLVAAVVLGCILLVAFRANRAHGQTSAAQAKPPPHVSPPVRADGIVVSPPGTHVTLSSELGGTIAQVLVKRGDRVRRGQVLVEFKKGEQMAALRETWARTGEARARMSATADERRRAKSLVTTGAAPKRELDDADHELRAARAHLTAEGATSSRIVANLEKTRIVAPIDGTVIVRTVEPGETVAVGTVLLEIADLTHLRIEAEVDEFYLGAVATGGPSVVTAEAFAGQSWKTSVEETSDTVVARRLHPQDPARPRDVGVLRVWVSLPEEHPLKLGQRVEVGFPPAPSGPRKGPELAFDSTP